MADRPGRSPAPARPSRRSPDPDSRPARGPELPPDVSGADLDPDIRRDLRSLPPAVAERVADHLAAAGHLLDIDPQQARVHALAARRLAPRIAAVREALGITAYATGEWALALSELRTVRRLTGQPDHLPVMADCERGLGRPERALALAHDLDVRRLDETARVEMLIVESGARRDMGEYDAAVVALQGPALDSTTLRSWTPRLWYAYADALLAAGRADEARQWFHAVAAVDDAGETDAEERLDHLGD